MNRFQPVTVPVQVVRMAGDYTTPALTTVDPNPVVAELPPSAPPPRAARKKKPRPPQGAAEAPPAAGSPFPPPPSR
jgi:hypothetical protein